MWLPDAIALKAPDGPCFPWSQEPAHTQGKASATGRQTTSCLLQKTYNPVATALSPSPGTLVSFPGLALRTGAPHRIYNARVNGT